MLILTWQDVVDQYWDKEHPFEEYIKHLSRRYEGEVAATWSEWEYMPADLPRDASLWHPQFAAAAINKAALEKIPKMW